MRSLRRKGSDPAPSRLAYRLNRLWLRPSVRNAVRVWLPLIACVLGFTYWMAAGDRIQRINDKIASIQTSIEERPEFMVKLMAIDGASPDLSRAVRDVMPVEFPVSSFDLDLEAMKRDVQELESVKQADIRILPGGLLQVNVTERLPVVIWRGPDGLELLDEFGVRVAGLAERKLRADLPVIAGEGAPDQVSEALKILQATRVMKDRVLGLVRVAELRWDLVLISGLRVMLPESRPLDALDRVLALDEAQELLARDVTHVDLRHGARPTLRLSTNAIEELRVMRGQLIPSDTKTLEN